MPTANPRKRAAPGASPAVQTQPIQQNFISGTTSLPNEGYLRWNPASQVNSYPDPSGYSTNIYGSESMPQTPFPAPVSAPSTQLARRPGNRQLVTTGQRTPYDEAGDPWSAFGDTGLEVQAPHVMDANDNIELLEEKAAIAKREAQAKRKQIPPFVQKLSSFLDESKNTELIRWSERGDSFVVLDEDEFAKTLIPELFKHNNYASFVRQLNMYGFHKRVGLSDNSMKASERKNKSPSEYSNPYFKRGHPNLLWLINKPKGGAGGKKGKGGRGSKSEDAEQSDEDGDGVDGEYGQLYGQNSIQGTSRAISAAPEPGQIQRREMSVVREQLKEIQATQTNISAAIARLRKDHQTMYQQAVVFQNLHERHESSINAILTFLATVYNRGLDGQGNAQNLAQMFANGTPQEQQHRQGDVVDIGDYNNREHQSQAPSSPQRRNQRLLMAPPLSRNQSGTANGTNGASASPSPASQFSRPTPGSIEELLEASPTPTTEPHLKRESEPQTPQQNIMNLINDTNANHTNQGKDTMGFPAVLSHYENANGNSPLTPEQRSDMLKLIANSSSGGTGIGMNNALVTPMPQNIMEPLNYTQAEIDELTRMQEEQANKLSEVSALLQPLSPGGLIPGLSDGLSGTPNGEYFDSAAANHANLDLDQYLNTDNFYNSADGQNFTYDDSFDGGGDLNFNFDTNGQGSTDSSYTEAGERIQEATNSSSTTPGTDRETTPTKRRRVA